MFSSRFPCCFLQECRNVEIEENKAPVCRAEEKACEAVGNGSEKNIV